MDCLRLSEVSDTLSYAGIFIDTELAELLKNSLLILQKENHFRKCYYWGRINGIQNDFHISYGFTKDCLHSQVFYYSTNCINWFLMPKTTKEAKLLAPLAVNSFEGDASIVNTVDSENFHFSLIEDQNQNLELVMKYLKEEDRLAATVELIKSDAMIIPRGGWFKCPNGDIILNPTFYGLTSSEASDLKSYLHARVPLEKWNTNLLTRPDYNYSMDFLDTIDLDIPLGCWNLQLYLGNQLAIVHSLYWPGMTFFHKLNTPHYGALYVGQGRKNMAVPFMI